MRSLKWLNKGKGIWSLRAVTLYTEADLTNKQLTPTEQFISIAQPTSTVRTNRNASNVQMKPAAKGVDHAAPNGKTV